MKEVSEVSDEMLVIHDGIVCSSGTEQELLLQTNQDSLEDAFVHLVTNGEGHE